MRRPLRLVAPVVLLLLLAVVPADAQSLRSKVEDLFRFGGGCTDPVCLSADGTHGQHFNPAARAGQTNLIVFLTDAIGVSASSIPISAASSGSIWSTSAEGFSIRTRTSAGPIFAERASTIGKGRLLVGSNASSFAYTTLRGVPLDGLVVTFTHEDGEPAGLGDPDFESDVIQVDTRIGMTLTAVTPFVTYGLTDRIDVSLAVPFIRSSLDGSTVAQVIQFASPTPHSFGSGTNPLLRATAASQGSATGLGDIALRIKAHLVQTARAGFGVLADARLATGDEENFLGAGTTTFRGLGILSLSYGAFSPHVNAGYNHRGRDQNGAILATVGFDHLMSPGVTLAVDLVSEWQAGESKLAFPEPVTLNTSVGTATSVRIVNPTNVPNRRDDRILTSIGAKFTSARGLTLVSNLLIPMLRGGLQPHVAWTFGLEYGF